MSKKQKIPSKEEILELYEREGCTISSLSRYYNKSNPTIRSWLIHYGIPRKSQKQASAEANKLKSSSPSKTELKEAYSKSSLKEIQSTFKIRQNKTYSLLKEYNLPIRTHSEATSLGKKKQYSEKQFSKELLEEIYERNQPIEKLAFQLSVSVSHLKKLFKSYNIKPEILYRSKKEMELFDYCREKYKEDEWVYCDKSVIAPYELDIVNKTRKIAIEYCGLYWHSENTGKKDSNYHFNKFLMCKKAGYKLITVFENDDMNKIKSLLDTLHQKNKRIYARNTEIVEINPYSARRFCEKYHMNGFVGGKYHYGLVHNLNLVMVCSFGVSRFNKKMEYECTRMACASGITVVGGASKLFKHFIKTVKPSSCVTYADLRFGEGDVYKHCGFKFEQYTGANYWYFHKDNTSVLFSRVKFQKHKLKDKLQFFDENLTEYQNMLANGWDRIWDCGNAKYIWHSNE
jgi:transposase-like protein